MIELIPFLLMIYVAGVLLTGVVVALEIAHGKMCRAYWWLPLAWPYYSAKGWYLILAGK